MKSTKDGPTTGACVSPNFNLLYTVIAAAIFAHLCRIISSTSHGWLIHYGCSAEDFSREGAEAEAFQQPLRWKLEKRLEEILKFPETW